MSAKHARTKEVKSGHDAQEPEIECPSQLIVRGFDYPIEYCERMPQGHDDAEGTKHEYPRKICVRTKDTDEKNIVMVLYHEMFHAMFTRSGNNRLETFNYQDEEEVVTALSEVFYDIVRENRDFMLWTTAVLTDN